MAKSGRFPWREAFSLLGTLAFYEHGEGDPDRWIAAVRFP